MQRGFCRTRTVDDIRNLKKTAKAAARVRDFS
jgi:hypothetical protein